MSGDFFYQEIPPPDEKSQNPGSPTQMSICIASTLCKLYFLNGIHRHLAHHTRQQTIAQKTLTFRHQLEHRCFICMLSCESQEDRSPGNCVERSAPDHTYGM